MTTIKDQSKFKNLIIAVSIAIPVVVVVLFNIKLPNVAPLNFLPPIYATINGITAILIIGALVAIATPAVSALNSRVIETTHLRRVMLLLGLLIMYYPSLVCITVVVRCGFVHRFFRWLVVELRVKIGFVFLQRSSAGRGSASPGFSWR